MRKLFGLISFEFRRLVGFLRRELPKKSGKHGPFIVANGIKEFLNGIFYFALGGGLILLARQNLKIVARWLFGNGGNGAFGKWISSVLGGSAIGKWIANLINHSFLEAYGKTLIHWADLIRGSLIALTIGTLFAYGSLSLALALGLYYHRKWAEYIMAIGSIVYVPLEVYGIWVYHSISAAIALAYNVFIICYLCKKKNLFTGYFSFHPDLHFSRGDGHRETEEERPAA